MNRFLSTLLLLILTVAQADAQAVVVRKRELNTGSSSGNLSTQISPSMTNSSMSGIYYSRYNHSIKLSPTALIAGDIPISYERKISDYFTVEGGVGLTTFNLTEDLIRGYSTRPEGETVSKVSYSALLNAKIFPEGNAFQDGYYIAFNLNHRDYAQDFALAMPGMEDSTFNESFQWSDLGFTMGYQSRPSERMILDWFIGAGIRQKTRKINEYVNTFDPISGLFTGGYVLNESRNTTPAILGGVKISVLFR